VWSERERLESSENIHNTRLTFQLPGKPLIAEMPMRMNSARDTFIYFSKDVFFPGKKNVIDKKIK